MNLATILPLISAIVVLYLGVLVYSHGKKEKLNINFAFFTLVIAFWMLSTFMMFLSGADTTKILFWDKIVYVSVVYIPVVMFNYGQALTRYQIIKGRLISIAGYILSTIFLFLIPTKYFVDGAFIYKWGVHSKAQIFHHFFLVYFSFYIILWFVIVYKYYKLNTDLLEQKRIKYSFISFIILAIFGSLGYLPAYGIGIYPFAYISGLFFTVIMTYAIIRHQLMDIRLVARKYLVYSAYVVTIALIFLFFKLITYTFVTTTFAQVIDLLLLVAAVTFTAPLKDYYYKFSNKHFFSSLYDSEDVLEEISIKLHATIDLQTICDDIYTTLKKNFHLQAMGVLRLKNRASNFRPLYAHNLALPNNILPNSTFLYDHFLSYNITVTTAQLKELNETKLYPIIEVLQEMKIAVLVPLIIKNDVIGVLALGNKESKDAYNEEDLRVLKIIAAQGATAIENARLYDEVQTFGETLQKKVDEQTREIQAKAEHLKKLMDMRSEFLDITSHQLRTPVSVIKGVLSMLEEGSIPKDREKAFIKGAMEKSIKLGEIINDILRASEMDSDKFTMTIREVDLNEMMKKIADDKVRSAEMKKLKFFMEIPVLPPVMTDPKYVEHAIVNLINNSIQYTVEGSITVTAEANPTHVIIRVSDTGIGIPPEAREKLFTKFARAANAVTTFTDGTGLGLFIIKQIVDANPGAKIEIERTEINKGTTFAYWLPRADVARST